jgi:hypothetical protein
MDGATHNGFSTLNSYDYNQSGIGGTRGGPVNGTTDFVADEGIQQQAFKAYTNSFFRRHLKGETFWFDALSGAWIPPSVNDVKVKLYFQFKHTSNNLLSDFNSQADDLNTGDGKALAILLLKHIETGTSSVDLTINSINLTIQASEASKFSVGSIISGAGLQEFSEVVSVSGSGTTRTVTMDRIAMQTAISVPVSIGNVRLDERSQHHSKALYLDLSQSANRIYEVYSGTSINVSSYQFFSFRIAKKFGSTVDLSALKVAIYNGSTSVLQNSPASIPDGFPRYDNTNLDKSAMMSLRFPLSGFTGLDATAISKVEIQFGTTSGIVEINDLEFSK